MLDYLIVADDLSGAADCAAAFCGAGAKPVVHLWPSRAGHVVAPAAIDLDSRRMTEGEAVAAVKAAIHAHFSGPPLRLYKKIDSTLRGHIGAEVAAALETVSEMRTAMGTSQGASGESCAAISGGCWALIAPAYPSLHRTIRGGRLVLRDEFAASGLSRTHEETAAANDLTVMLEKVGLATACLELPDIRSGQLQLRERLARLGASGCGAIICDAETDDDLLAVARASLEAQSIGLWVGSAGFAKKLAAASRQVIATGPALPSTGPALPSILGQIVTIVGSAAPASRRQAKALAAISQIASFSLPEATLKIRRGEAWREVKAAFAAQLQARRDVLLTVEEARDPFSLDCSLAAALAEIISPSLARIGAVVATGGDTARVVFDQLGVVRLIVEGEIEAGVVAATAHGAWGGTVVIKAGAFGDENSLKRAHAVLAAKRIVES